MDAVFILKVQTACMYFDVGLYIGWDLEIRKSGLHYDKKKKDCTVTRKKQTAFVYTELNYQRPKVQVSRRVCPGAHTHPSAP
jgi:hypothetical protein